ncbi:MAG: UDP-N-acetylmuramate:L-alanyl-gamma-D-glutamyl-meso-diaminopimelate ligase [Kangiellaceae bacterium]|nr:UDP-N-acetylmuramate:L-alanyl-gamma-D-glutamyl-meso-diaminopimelate ligase [Kangiellaceae bacterium]
MHLHILGICGTFMGGIARLAVEKGFTVTGSDLNCYPPMSDQLEKLGITLHEGYDAEQLKAEPDCVVVGNSLSRGKPVIEALLNSNQVYRSGPQWLSENILADKWVIAAAGTHGKTSTASMITWILEACGYNPGFLVGGVLENFGVSARYTDSPFFIVEADEYDTAFFDKRSKFVHYRAKTCVLNNLEFDHADIFDDLKAIENQFHHLVRTIPNHGVIIRPHQSRALDRVLQRGVWSPVQKFSDIASKDNEWSARKLNPDGSEFEVFLRGECKGVLSWELIGDHNVNNALAAIAAAHHVGVEVENAIKSLASFKNVKRRMQLRGRVNDIMVFDDFAHHPTAIRTTLNGLRNKVGEGRIIAVVDLRSNTMKQGIHKDSLVAATAQADKVIFHMPDFLEWELKGRSNSNVSIYDCPDKIVEVAGEMVNPGDTVLVMSNGGFGGIHEKLLQKFENTQLPQGGGEI